MRSSISLKPLHPRGLALVMVMLAALVVSGCADTTRSTPSARKGPWPGEQVATNGNYKVGKPYQVGGEWYYPSEDFSKTETGIASWYGPNFHGKRTANGEKYDQNELTAAHRTLQMPSLVRVTNLENGRSVVVRINDRGPFKRGRVIDVSKRAAELLGFIGQGTARVRLEVLEKESRKIAAAAQSGQDTSRITLADLNRIPDSETALVASAPPIQNIPLLQQASFDGRSLNQNAPGPRFANPTQDPMMPESLRTPTITVEEINRGNAHLAPTPYTPSDTSRRTLVATSSAAPQPEFSGHVDDTGRFMPDAVVQTEPVVPTGLFVQAGSFSVRDNAERMSRQLATIAPAQIEQVNVNGRTLFRVKLGPLADLTEADAVLARMASAGTSGGRVINTQ